MQKQPVIGFSLDYETNGGYSKLPWFAIRENYCTSVSAQGAIPIALPQESNLVDQYLAMIDGLIVTGGAFDVPPSMYGDSSTHETVVIKENRTLFEYAITKGALKKNIPILGICGGEQLLNVVLGGTLIQHIPDSYETDIEHEQPNDRHEPGHTVKVTEGSLLHKIAGKSEFPVNSAHHQAVDKVADGTIINAVAPDKVIEGIEYPSHPFCLGVQWHPEYHVSEVDANIFKAFVDACRA